MHFIVMLHTMLYVLNLWRFLMCMCALLCIFTIIKRSRGHFSVLVTLWPITSICSLLPEPNKGRSSRHGNMTCVQTWYLLYIFLYLGSSTLPCSTCWKTRCLLGVWDNWVIPLFPKWLQLPFHRWGSREKYCQTQRAGHHETRLLQHMTGWWLQNLTLHQTNVWPISLMETTLCQMFSLLHPWNRVPSVAFCSVICLPVSPSPFLLQKCSERKLITF